MATNIEQIFRSFVVNKFKEIQEEKLNSENAESSQNGELTQEKESTSEDNTVAVQKEQSEQTPQNMESVPSEALGLEQPHISALEDSTSKELKATEVSSSDEVKKDGSRKKSKKHKKHKSKKKKKKKKKEKNEKRSKSTSSEEDQEDVQLEPKSMWKPAFASPAKEGDKGDVISKTESLSEMDNTLGVPSSGIVQEEYHELAKETQPMKIQADVDSGFFGPKCPNEINLQRSANLPTRDETEVQELCSEPVVHVAIQSKTIKPLDGIDTQTTTQTTVETDPHSDSSNLVNEAQLPPPCLDAQTADSNSNKLESERLDQSSSLSASNDVQHRPDNSGRISRSNSASRVTERSAAKSRSRSKSITGKDRSRSKSLVKESKRQQIRSKSPVVTNRTRSSPSKQRPRSRSSSLGRKRRSRSSTPPRYSMSPIRSWWSKSIKNRQRSRSLSVVRRHRSRTRSAVRRRKSKTRSPVRRNRSRSRSPSRRRRSRSRLASRRRRSRSRLAGRRQRSRSRSGSQRRKSRSRSATGRRRSRSTSVRKRRRSRSTSVRRRRSRSRSASRRRRSRSRSASRRRRSRSRSASRRRRSRSRSASRRRRRRSRSRSASRRRRRSRSRSASRRRRSQSVSASRRRRSRSTSASRRRRSRSTSTSRRQRSRSIVRTRRSRSLSVRRRKSRSQSTDKKRRSKSPTKSRRSRSLSAARRHRSGSVARKRRSRSSSVDRKQRSPTATKMHRSRSRSSTRKRRSRSVSRKQKSRSRSAEGNQSRSETVTKARSDDKIGLLSKSPASNEKSLPCKLTPNQNQPSLCPQPRSPIQAKDQILCVDALEPFQVTSTTVQPLSDIEKLETNSYAQPSAKTLSETANIFHGTRSPSQQLNHTAVQEVSTLLGEDRLALKTNLAQNEECLQIDKPKEQHPHYSRGSNEPGSFDMAIESNVAQENLDCSIRENANCNDSIQDKRHATDPDQCSELLYACKAQEGQTSIDLSGATHHRSDSLESRSSENLCKQEVFHPVGVMQEGGYNTSKNSSDLSDPKLIKEKVSVTVGPAISTPLYTPISTETVQLKLAPQVDQSCEIEPKPIENIEITEPTISLDTASEQSLLPPTGSLYQIISTDNSSKSSSHGTGDLGYVEASTASIKDTTPSALFVKSANSSIAAPELHSSGASKNVISQSSASECVAHTTSIFNSEQEKREPKEFPTSFADQDMENAQQVPCSNVKTFQATVDTNAGIIRGMQASRVEVVLHATSHHKELACSVPVSTEPPQTDEASDSKICKSATPDPHKTVVDTTLNRNDEATPKCSGLSKFVSAAKDDIQPCVHTENKSFVPRRQDVFEQPSSDAKSWISNVKHGLVGEDPPKFTSGTAVQESCMSLETIEDMPSELCEAPTAVKNAGQSQAKFPKNQMFSTTNVKQAKLRQSSSNSDKLTSNNTPETAFDISSGLSVVQTESLEAKDISSSPSAKTALLQKEQEGNFALFGEQDRILNTNRSDSSRQARCSEKESAVASVVSGQTTTPHYSSTKGSTHEVEVSKHTEGSLNFGNERFQFSMVNKKANLLSHPETLPLMQEPSPGNTQKEQSLSTSTSKLDVQKSEVSAVQDITSSPLKSTPLNLKFSCTFKPISITPLHVRSDTSVSSNPAPSKDTSSTSKLSSSAFDLTKVIVQPPKARFLPVRKPSDSNIVVVPEPQETLKSTSISVNESMPSTDLPVSENVEFSVPSAVESAKLQSSNGSKPLLSDSPAEIRPLQSSIHEHQPENVETESLPKSSQKENLPEELSTASGLVHKEPDSLHRAEPSQSETTAKPSFSHVSNAALKTGVKQRHYRSRSIAQDSRSPSVDRMRASRSKSTTRKRRSRSKSAHRKRRSPSARRRSHSKSARRRRSRSKSRGKRKRSKSKGRKKHSPSKLSGKRRHTRSRSPETKKRSKSTERRKRRSKSPIRRSSSRSRSATRKKWSPSKTGRSKASRSNSPTWKRKSRSKSASSRSRSRSKSATRRRFSKSRVRRRPSRSSSKSTSPRRRSHSRRGRRVSRSPGPWRRTRSRSSTHRRTSRSRARWRRSRSLSTSRNRSRSSSRLSRSLSVKKRRRSLSKSPLRRRRSRSQTRQQGISPRRKSKSSSPPQKKTAQSKPTAFKPTIGLKSLIQKQLSQAESQSSSGKLPSKEQVPEPRLIAKPQSSLSTKTQLPALNRTSRTQSRQTSGGQLGMPSLTPNTQLPMPSITEPQIPMHDFATETGTQLSVPELSTGGQWPLSDMTAGAQWPMSELAAGSQWSMSGLNSGSHWPVSDMSAGAQWPMTDLTGGAQWHMSDMSAAPHWAMHDVSAGSQWGVPDMAVGSQWAMHDMAAGSQWTMSNLATEAQWTMPHLAAGTHWNMPTLPPTAQVPVQSLLTEAQVPVSSLADEVSVSVTDIPSDTHVLVPDMAAEAPVPDLAPEAPVHVPESVAEVPVHMPESVAEVPVHVPESAAEVPAHVPEMAAEVPAHVPEMAAEVPSHVPELVAEVPVHVSDLAAEVPVHMPDLAATVPIPAPDLAAEVPVHVPDLTVEAPVPVPDLAAEVPVHVPNLSFIVPVPVPDLTAETLAPVTDLATEALVPMPSLATEIPVPTLDMTIEVPVPVPDLVAETSVPVPDLVAETPVAVPDLVAEAPAPVFDLVAETRTPAAEAPVPKHNLTAETQVLNLAAAAVPALTSATESDSSTDQMHHHTKCEPSISKDASVHTEQIALMQTSLLSKPPADLNLISSDQHDGSCNALIPESSASRSQQDQVKNIATTDHTLHGKWPSSHLPIKSAGSFEYPLAGEPYTSPTQFPLADKPASFPEGDHHQTEPHPSSDIQQLAQPRTCPDLPSITKPTASNEVMLTKSSDNPNVVLAETHVILQDAVLAGPTDYSKQPFLSESADNDTSLANTKPLPKTDHVVLVEPYLSPDHRPSSQHRGSPDSSAQTRPWKDNIHLIDSCVSTADPMAKSCKSSSQTILVEPYASPVHPLLVEPYSSPDHYDNFDCSVPAESCASVDRPGLVEPYESPDRPILVAPYVSPDHSPNAKQNLSSDCNQVSGKWEHSGRSSPPQHCANPDRSPQMEVYACPQQSPILETNANIGCSPVAEHYTSSALPPLEEASGSSNCSSFCEPEIYPNCSRPSETYARPNDPLSLEPHTSPSGSLPTKLSPTDSSLLTKPNASPVRFVLAPEPCPVPTHPLLESEPCASSSQPLLPPDGPTIPLLPYDNIDQSLLAAENYASPSTLMEAADPYTSPVGRIVAAEIFVDRPQVSKEQSVDHFPKPSEPCLSPEQNQLATELGPHHQLLAATPCATPDSPLVAVLPAISHQLITEYSTSPDQPLVHECSASPDLPLVEEPCTSLQHDESRDNLECQLADKPCADPDRSLGDEPYTSHPLGDEPHGDTERPLSHELCASPLIDRPYPSNGTGLVDKPCASINSPLGEELCSRPPISEPLGLQHCKSPNYSVQGETCDTNGLPCNRTKHSQENTVICNSNPTLMDLPQSGKAAHPESEDLPLGTEQPLFEKSDVSASTAEPNESTFTCTKSDFNWHSKTQLSERVLASSATPETTEPLRTSAGAVLTSSTSVPLFSGELINSGGGHSEGVLEADQHCKTAPPDLMPYDSEQPASNSSLSGAFSEQVLLSSQPPPELLPYDSEQPTNSLSPSDYSSEQATLVFQTPPELLPYDSEQPALLHATDVQPSPKEKMSVSKPSGGSGEPEASGMPVSSESEFPALNQLSGSTCPDSLKQAPEEGQLNKDKNLSVVDLPMTDIQLESCNTSESSNRTTREKLDSVIETSDLLHDAISDAVSPREKLDSAPVRPAEQAQLPTEENMGTLLTGQITPDEKALSLLTKSEEISVSPANCSEPVMTELSTSKEKPIAEYLEQSTERLCANESVLVLEKPSLPLLISQEPEVSPLETSNKQTESKAIPKQSSSNSQSTSRSRHSRSRSPGRKKRSCSKSEDVKRSRSRSTTRRKRSHSKSVVRRRRTRSKSVTKSKRSRSKSATRRKSRTKSPTRKRSRSKSVGRGRRSCSDSPMRRRRSRSTSPVRRRRSRSPSLVRRKPSRASSPSRRRRSRSASPVRRRRSRSASPVRRRRSRSASPVRRRRSRSASPVRRRRSRSASPVRRRRSRSSSPVRRRRSRSSSPVRRRRSRSSSPVRRRRSRSSSPVRRRRSRSKSPVRRRRSRSSSPVRKRRSRSASPLRKRKTYSESPIPRSPTEKQRAGSKSDRSRSRSQGNATRKRKTRSRSMSKDKTKSSDKRRKRSTSKDHYSAKSRRRSRTPPRRKKSRSPVRRAGMCISPVRRRRSRSPIRRKSFSRSPTRRKRSRSREKSLELCRSPKRLTDLDKAQLLEIAKANAAAMCAKAGVPLPPSLKPVVTPVASAEEKITHRTYGVTIQELTEKCKQIAQSKEDDVIVNKPHDSDEEEEERPFYNHPFKVSEHKPISFSLLNPSIKPAPKTQVTLTKEFPVSSGSQHRKKEDKVYGEWVPVDKKTEESKDDVFTNAGPSEPIDITAAMNERAIAQTRLTGNPFDLEALFMLNRSQEQIDAWAQSTSLPGQFTGSTGAQVLSADEISNSGPQAWLKKDQFLKAAPVSGGRGALLMRKMGWREGEGLGRHNEGNVNPILIDFKTDRKGLVADGEKAPNKLALPVMKDLSGKHPISVLMELCNKKKWSPPEFVLIDDTGPEHRKRFLFRVTVNGTVHQPSQPSVNKKLAKATAAAAALQGLGALPKESMTPTTSFRSASDSTS